MAGERKSLSQLTSSGKSQGFVVSPSGVRSRYTDKETAEIYTMVMAGKLNKSIVRMLLRHGIKAAGITGIDGGVLKADRKKKLVIINDRGRKMVIDGGYTGKINSVDPSLITVLLEKEYVPVISPVALSEEYDFLNVDGDRADGVRSRGSKSYQSYIYNKCQRPFTKR